jgi:hypothetical protein
MGIVGVYPAVYIRAASKELTVYGTWKSAQGADLKEFIFGFSRASSSWHVALACGGQGDFNTEFTEDTEMRRSGGRSDMGSNYQRAR